MNGRVRWIGLMVAVLLFLFGTIAPRRADYGQGKPIAQRVEAEVVVLHRWGFDPATLTRPKGKFILVVDNRSGVVDLDLRLDKVAGSRVNEAHAADHRQHDWINAVDLQPGDYQLTEANHPKWMCKITIKPN